MIPRVHTATDAFGNALGSSLAASTQPSPTYGATFAEDSAGRRAMNPLTNGGVGVSGEPDYSSIGNSRERNSNLLGAPDYSSVDETFAENHARLTAENTYIPQVVITGERMTPAQKEASLAEERMLAQYGSRAAWETAQLFNGAKDSVKSIPGAIAGTAKGAYGLATGDPATLMRASQSWNRLSSMTVGGMIDAAGRGIVASSPLGIATAFASGDPYSAGGRTGMAVLGAAVPVAGRFGTDGLETVGRVGASNADAAIAGARSEAASNIRQARQILADTRLDLTISERNQIIKAFDPVSFRVNSITSPISEFRYFDGLPDGAAPLARLNSPTFGQVKLPQAGQSGL